MISIHDYTLNSDIHTLLDKGLKKELDLREMLISEIKWSPAVFEEALRNLDYNVFLSEYTESDIRYFIRDVNCESYDRIGDDGETVVININIDVNEKAMGVILLHKLIDNIPFYEDKDSSVCIDTEWNGFAKGTKREDIFCYLEDTFNIKVENMLSDFDKEKLGIDDEKEMDI